MVTINKISDEELEIVTESTFKISKTELLAGKAKLEAKLVKVNEQLAMFNK